MYLLYLLPISIKDKSQLYRYYVNLLEIINDQNNDSFAIENLHINSVLYEY